MTDYVVLGSYEDQWTKIGTVNARSPKHAIRIIKVPERIAHTDLFVAVPARSWKPVTVKVETKTALKFS